MPLQLDRPQSYQGQTWGNQGGFNRVNPFDTSGINDRQDKYRTMQGAMAQQLWDFGSPLYQKHRASQAMRTPTLGVNAMLAPLMAGGGNTGASQVQANALQQNYLRQRNDFLNQSTNDFFSQNIGQAGNLISQAQQSFMGQEQTKLQHDAQTADFGDWAAALAPGILSLGLAPFTGGASLMAYGAMQAGKGGGGGGGGGFSPPGYRYSDKRLKEKISYTGEKTKDGIPVAEFNFKGSDDRFRGVIAQDVEKIRPDAVMEIDNIKYVDYSSL